MRKLCFLFFSIFIAGCLFSCKPGGSDVIVIDNAKQLIVGKWNLQQQRLTQYIDGVKKTDTMVTASNSLKAFTQFNQSGSYTSVSIIFPTSTNLEGAIAGRDSLAGTYKISNTSLDISAPYLAGFIIGTPAFGSTTEVAVIAPVSQSVQLVQLTTKLLTIHTEFIFNFTYPSTGLITNYKTVSDLYYGK